MSTGIQRPEQDPQRALFGHLAWRRVPNTFSFHIPNGGRRSPIEAAIMKSLGVVPGIPNVLSIKDGRRFALELKAEGGSLSRAQLQALEQMRAAGAEVTTAVGIDEALGQLKAWGLLR